MPSNITILFLLVFIFAVCLSGNGVYAFGAGNIPGFAYMEGKAFRHGDIEDALSGMMKRTGGFASAIMLSKGSKFSVLDIKRVYFGNWLRDYSQAVDIASLKKCQIQTIINLCMALGFLAHGYATHEFEVTEERLGVYLPTEHIDNPKGYGQGEDPRMYHPKLRGPVDPRELEVDPQTGMKNYIANENGHWDTSKALVRRTIEQCINIGRRNRANGDKHDEYEAYRLLGQALHTLEDFAAHSNFCEIALVALGHHDVFLQVGDQVRIQAPGGKWVAPLVTGTFGSSDFTHSLLGEATDHISEASVSDLNKELEKARAKSVTSRSGSGSSDPGDVLRDLLFKIPGGGGSDMSREMDGINRIRAGPSQGGKRPEDMSPQELHAVLWQVLTFRDSVVKKIEITIERIPGLGPLIEKLQDSISVFVLTTLEPFLRPILKTATTSLQAASGEVINTHDQYEVFDDPRAGDPTHSFLSKDHFNLILNEPAGHLAQIILIYAVPLITKAWDDNSVNIRQTTETILECLFHPDFHNNNSEIQRKMMHYMQTWVQGLGHQQHSILGRLRKNAVRNHENIRLGGEGGKPQAQGSFAYQEGMQVQQNILGHIPLVGGLVRSGDGNLAGYRGVPDEAHSYGSYSHSSGYSSSFSGSNSSGGPPALSSSTPQHSGYAPSYAAPTSFPGSGGSGPPSSDHAHYGKHEGYAPPSGPPDGRYDSPPGRPGDGYSAPTGGPPAFPGGPPAFPAAPHAAFGGRHVAPGVPPPFPSGGPGFGTDHHAGGGYGAPSFPGAGPTFPGAGPSFPGAGPPFPGAGPPFPGAGPAFPGADPQNQFSGGEYPPPGGAYAPYERPHGW